MVRSILRLLWGGLWTGFGVEGSFLFLYGIWHFFYGKHAHKIDAGHWLHKIHDYFSN